MSLAQLFGILFAVNLLTIGGGYVMLPMLHGIFVERYALLTNREFTDALALGQLTPGPLTIMNTFIGYKLMGFAGAAAATLGTYLPSLIVVTLVTKYYVAFKDSRAVAGFISAKAQALLFDLAVTGRPHMREALAGLLWGEMPEAHASKNLRNALSNLRALVGAYLLIARDEVAFNRDSPYWLDPVTCPSLRQRYLPQVARRLRVISLGAGEVIAVQLRGDDADDRHQPIRHTRRQPQHGVPECQGLVVVR